MFYTRAAASDYDDWENVYGNKGWGSKYLIPLLKKVRVSDLFTLELATVLFIGGSVSITVKEFHPWKIRADQSIVCARPLEYLQKFFIRC